MDSAPLWLGTLACTLAAAAGLLPLPRRLRLAGLTLAVALAPLLVVADNWDTERLVDIREDPFAFGAALSAAAFGVALLALLLRRRPLLLAPLLVAAMPFRIPIDLGGESVNLLLPLYGVLGAGLLAAWMGPVAGEGAGEPAAAGRGPLRFIGVALAAVVVLYGLQAGLADDISPAIRNVAFFLAPFALLFHLLGSVSWDGRALRSVLVVLAVEGLVFAAVGAYQYASGELFWNDKVIEGNEAHAYFRINSLFFDPNILGRYLAVTMTALAALVAFGRGRAQVDRRERGLRRPAGDPRRDLLAVEHDRPDRRRPRARRPPLRHRRRRRGDRRVARRGCGLGGAHLRRRPERGHEQRPQRPDRRRRRDLEGRAARSAPGRAASRPSSRSGSGVGPGSRSRATPSRSRCWPRAAWSDSRPTWS